jgi:hypothetical protein
MMVIEAPAVVAEVVCLEHVRVSRSWSQRDGELSAGQAESFSAIEKARSIRNRNPAILLSIQVIEI